MTIFNASSCEIVREFSYSDEVLAYPYNPLPLPLPLPLPPTPTPTPTPTPNPTPTPTPNPNPLDDLAVGSRRQHDRTWLGVRG